ncbi:hypothetical protein [Pseudacidobacterium ailaaui]|uniref:hypothetical protein n=1 Tax=Pseudacidobacterium ailaaui TaxID=1382359 RepID=UPI000679D692|nr:hypothetical protein [Pseudacidobacterium ailaaui]
MKRIAGTWILAVAFVLFSDVQTQAQVGISVQIGAPVVAVPAYAPPCPGPGYLWVPGYDAGAVWVPGHWVYRGHWVPRYDRPYGDDREDRGWYPHDHGHHYGWYKHHDDDDWDR